MKTPPKSSSSTCYCPVTVLSIRLETCKQMFDSRRATFFERRRMISEQQADTPHWGLVDLRRAHEAAGVALWSWNVDNDRITMDEHGFRLWDVGVQREITFEDLSEKIHPADRERVRNAFSATRAVDGAYDIDFRIMCNESVRWISARGQGGDADIVGFVMFGIFLDITARTQAEEAHELLAGEMSHRVKNLLAIASSLTTMASRSAVNAEDMAHDLTTRLAALGRAHDLVRPKPNERNAALVGDLISVVLAPTTRWALSRAGCAYLYRGLPLATVQLPILR
ncbi:HWE histidine kinase domain-containing protein [Sphingomonas qilianensis]|uniref:histidine kinase n=1 Tax=Sphingomonas qilianensis TaxID=1736690 RepID=A0ABU9XWS5_9SPHN